MTDWIPAALDLVLILMIGAGLVQVTRLIRQLAILKQGRAEMDRFVKEFNGTVARAEAGIKGLRNTARESGDDLEKLLNKATMVRDELHFLVESADQIAERLSQQAATVVRPTESKPRAESAPVAAPLSTRTSGRPTASAASRAEKELMQALQKLN